MSLIDPLTVLADVSESLDNTDTHHDTYVGLTAKERLKRAQESEACSSAPSTVKLRRERRSRRSDEEWNKQSEMGAEITEAQSVYERNAFTSAFIQNVGRASNWCCETRYRKHILRVLRNATYLLPRLHLQYRIPLHSNMPLLVLALRQLATGRFHPNVRAQLIGSLRRDSSNFDEVLWFKHPLDSLIHQLFKRLDNVDADELLVDVLEILVTPEAISRHHDAYTEIFRLLGRRLAEQFGGGGRPNKGRICTPRTIAWIVRHISEPLTSKICARWMEQGLANVRKVVELLAIVPPDRLGFVRLEDIDDQPVHNSAVILMSDIVQRFHSSVMNPSNQDDESLKVALETFSHWIRDVHQKIDEHLLSYDLVCAPDLFEQFVIALQKKPDAKITMLEQHYDGKSLLARLLGGYRFQLLLLAPVEVSLFRLLDEVSVLCGPSPFSGPLRSMLPGISLELSNGGSKADPFLARLYRYLLRIPPLTHVPHEDHPISGALEDLLQRCYGPQALKQYEAVLRCLVDEFARADQAQPTVEPIVSSSDSSSSSSSPEPASVTTSVGDSRPALISLFDHVIRRSIHTTCHLTWWTTTEWCQYEADWPARIVDRANQQASKGNMMGFRTYRQRFESAYEEHWPKVVGSIRDVVLSHTSLPEAIIVHEIIPHLLPQA